MLNETWFCYGSHPPQQRRQALLIWRMGKKMVPCLVRKPDRPAYASMLTTLLARGRPERVQADDAEVAEVLDRVLRRQGIEVDYVPCLPPADVDRLACEFVMTDIAHCCLRSTAPREDVDRLRDALVRLRSSESWLHLPMNLSLVVHGLEPRPLGILVHADCCPGFTVLPLDAALQASIRVGTVVVRLQQGMPFGVEGRWPVIVEEQVAPHQPSVFRTRQRRLSLPAVERVEACVDVVLGLACQGGRVPDRLTLDLRHPVEVHLREQPLGVMSMTIPFNTGDQHIRLRAS